MAIVTKPLVLDETVREFNTDLIEILSNITKAEAKAAEAAESAETASERASSATQASASAIQALRDATLIANSGNADTLSTANATDIINIREDIYNTQRNFTSGKNMFNKDNVIRGYYVNYSDGKRYANASYCIYKIIIDGNKDYALSRACQIAYFKADDGFISGEAKVSNGASTYKTPTNTAYMWVSAKISDLDIFQVELGTDVTSYEKYYNVLAYPKNVNRINIIVAQDGTGDFTKITDALNYALDFEDCIIYVEEGTYDFIQELGESYFENFVYAAYSNEGPKIGNGTTLIMSSGARIVCHYTGNNTEVMRGFSPLNAYINNKGYTLDNVTIECSRVRYCVHDDVGSQRAMYKNEYKNCKMIINNTDNTVYQSHCALGGGLGINGEVIIKDCYFQSLMNDGVYSYAVAYHNSGANTDREKSRIVFSGNYVAGIDTVQFTDHGTSLYPTDCFVSNNNLGAAVRHRKTSESVPTNMNVIEWNNYIR